MAIRRPSGDQSGQLPGRTRSAAAASGAIVHTAPRAAKAIRSPVAADADAASSRRTTAARTRTPASLRAADERSVKAARSADLGRVDTIGDDAGFRPPD